MSQRWPGGIVRNTPVTPSGPYQNSSASGVWTMDQADYWIKQGNWPTQGATPPFDENNIVIPLPAATYQVRFISYNWSTNTSTSLAYVNPFYTAGGFYMPSVALDPSKNVYISGGGATGNSSYVNFAYVASGSSSISTFYYSSGLYSSYNDKYGRLCWNPSAGAMQTNLYPFSAETSSTTAYILTVGSSSATRGGSTPVFGSFFPDMDLLRTYSTTGAVTNGTTMLAQAGNSISANNNYTFSATSPYTSFSSIAGSFSSNASSNSIAPVSLTSAVVVANGYLKLVTTAGSSTALSSIGGIADGSFEQVTPLASGAFMACNVSPYGTVYAYGSASNTPTWSTNLSSLFSGRQIFYMIGAGNTAYVISKQTSSPYNAYITKIVFDLSAGTYTSTDRALGYTCHATEYKPATYRYY